MRSRIEPWNKPSKACAKFDKVQWNKSRTTFRKFRKAVDGHLLQADAGYLIDPVFLTEYEFQKDNQQHLEYLKSDEYWVQYEVPFALAKIDRKYLYVNVKIPPKWYSVLGGGSCYVADSIPFYFRPRQDR